MKAIQPGVKGWLQVFAAMLFFSAMRVIFDIVMYFKNNVHVINVFPIIVFIDLFLLIVNFWLIAWCGWLLATRSARIKDMFSLLFLFYLFGLPLGLIIVMGVSEFKYGLIIDIYDLLSSVVVGAWLGGTISTGLWLLYLRRSRRVAITMVNP